MGNHHTLIICHQDSLVQGVGYNGFGNLGNGGTTSSSVPVNTSFISEVIEISAGQSHSLALLADGTVWTWGSNLSGQSGNGTIGGFVNTPIQVAGLTNIVGIDAGSLHSFALRDDGRVFAWGGNGSGQCGVGSLADVLVPTMLTSLTNISDVQGGGSHSVFLKNDGTVWACGSNGSGELGDGTNTQRLTPVQVAGLVNATAISVGAWDHSMALRNDSTVWGWGNGSGGSLGTGTGVTSNVPLQASGAFTDVVAISAEGFHHSMVMRADNSVWFMGSNNFGQAGNGSTGGSFMSPFQIPLIADAIAIDAATWGCGILRSDSTLWVTGFNASGQLGIGSQVSQSSYLQSGFACSVYPFISNQLPDLSVLAIVPVANPVCLTDPVSFNVVIQNQGLAASGPFDIGVYNDATNCSESARTPRNTVASKVFRTLGHGPGMWIPIVFFWFGIRIS